MHLKKSVDICEKIESKRWNKAVRTWTEFLNAILGACVLQLCLCVCVCEYLYAGRDVNDSRGIYVFGLEKDI